MNLRDLIDTTALRSVILIRLVVGWVFLSEEFRSFCSLQRMVQEGLRGLGFPHLT